MNSNGKYALVTGATNGIGKVTALELARQGYAVGFTSRSAEKGQQVLSEIRAATGNDALELYVGDLSSMDSVRRIALEVRQKHPRVDVLVNNAGGVFMERQTTVDGFEYTFAFNHLAYFLLTRLLEDALKASGDARVINVSSSAHYSGKMRWDDLEFSSRYSGFAAYAQSKLLNVLFSNALARRLRGTGVTSNALHPGVVNTGFGDNSSGLLKSLFGLLKRYGAITPEKGAETSLYLATSSEVQGVTGQFFENKKAKRPSALALDEAAQQRLWDLSEKLVSRWLDPVERAVAEAKV